MTTLIDSALGRLGLRVRAPSSKLERPDWLASDGGATFVMEEWNTRKLQRQAMACSWAYSDISLLARKAGQATFKVVRQSDGETEDVNDHPFTALMRRPNEIMAGSFLLNYTMMWLQLAGNAYWWLGYNYADDLVELWPLPAREVTPVKARNGSNEVLAGYRYNPLGKNTILEPKRICHFRLANPFNPLDGMSPLMALRREIQGDLAMKQWNVNFFDKRNAIPTVIVSLPQSTRNADFKRVRDTIYREFGGANRRALVTRAGDFSVESVGLSQRDMDFLAGIELNRETIDRVFGIPAGYWAKEATRANSTAAMAILMRDTVQPTMDYFAQEIDAQIIDRFYDADQSVVAESMVPADRDLDLEEFKEHKNVLTIDEARALLNRQPLDDSDLGGTLVPLAIQGAPMMAMALPQKGDDESGETDETETSEADEIEAEDNERTKALRDELMTWRKVALREVARGRDPGGREFISELIPPYVRSRIEAALLGQSDTEIVRTVFEPWMRGLAEGWRAYP